MMLIGVDYHPSFQTIAFFVEETGEYGEQELNHSDGQAEKFYRDLKQRGICVRVGMEATGYSRWFERLLAELGFELWIGDPAEIKAKRVKKQKFDREDARLLLRLMRENNFPQIWIPGPENRDLRQLLWHRHRLVQMRTRIMNQLQALAMNEGYRWKKKLFSEPGRAQLEKLALGPWASRRRQELLELLDRMNPTIEELTAAVDREAKKRPEALRLMTHPGVGPITALAYVLIIGTPTRFQRGKQIGTYVGMIPCEESSARPRCFPCVVEFLRDTSVTAMETAEVPQALQHTWSGHARTHVSEVYKKLLKQCEWRLGWAERAGMGFSLPERKNPRNAQLAQLIEFRKVG